MNTNERKKAGTVSKPMRVVVADDEPLIIMNLTEILTANNFEVMGTAADGFEVIDICQEHKPDVVLMDIQMPMLDGLAASQYIFENSLAETIVMITAYKEDIFVEKAGEIGVAGYLVKPINAKSLIPTINIASARSKELRSLKREVLAVQNSMKARKKIERAKSHLMNRDKLSDQEAYDFIRQISKDRSMSMEKVADIILLGVPES